MQIQPFHLIKLKLNPLSNNSSPVPYLLTTTILFSVYEFVHSWVLCIRIMKFFFFYVWLISLSMCQNLLFWLSNTLFLAVVQWDWWHWDTGSLVCWGAGSIPGLAQWVKELATATEHTPQTHIEPEPHDRETAAHQTASALSSRRSPGGQSQSSVNDL